MIHLIIDGQPVDVEEGTTILQEKSMYPYSDIMLP